MFTRVEEAIVWSEIDAARRELGSYLRTLSEEEWSHPSMCDGWMVRDVVAHLILEYSYGILSVSRGMLKSRFRINLFLKDTAIWLGKLPTDELIKRFDDLVGDRHAPTGGPINVLVDLLVHEQDIQIPLGDDKSMPLSALRIIFEHWEPSKLNFGERLTGLSKRIVGLKIISTDVPFQVGEGAYIESKAEDVLLAVMGRAIAIDRLSGPGVPVLARRLK